MLKKICLCHFCSTSGFLNQFQSSMAGKGVTQSFQKSPGTFYIETRIKTRRSPYPALQPCIVDGHQRILLRADARIGGRTPLNAPGFDKLRRLRDILDFLENGSESLNSRSHFPSVFPPEP